MYWTHGAVHNATNGCKGCIEKLVWRSADVGGKVTDENLGAGALYAVAFVPVIQAHPAITVKAIARPWAKRFLSAGAEVYDWCVMRMHDGLHDQRNKYDPGCTECSVRGQDRASGMLVNCRFVEDLDSQV